MAQNWAIIGFLAATFVGMIAMMQRSMSMQSKMFDDALRGHRSELQTGLGGLQGEMHASFEALRGEMHASFGGLRNETAARFESVDRRFDSVEGQLSRLASLDREVHALTLKVFRDEPPET